MEQSALNKHRAWVIGILESWNTTFENDECETGCCEGYCECPLPLDGLIERLQSNTETAEDLGEAQFQLDCKFEGEEDRVDDMEADELEDFRTYIEVSGVTEEQKLALGINC